MQASLFEKEWAYLRPIRRNGRITLPKCSCQAGALCRPCGVSVAAEVSLVINLPDCWTLFRLDGGNHHANLGMQDSDYRPTRRLGGAGPQTGRVLNLQTDEAESSVPPDCGLLTTALRDVLRTSRPTSAPSCLHVVKKGLTAEYKKARGAHEDAAHGGQFSGTSQQATAKRPGTAQPACFGEVLVQQNSFVDRQICYHMNKVRNQMSDIM
ncbi:hypothetical protein VOLCADRAFT_94165 [Volvox carteri f. nagariensis]|uniref:Uncharacterized protein n=1 Tax=Volvox carteri f. nagariensis TaxID=3068 RepID=D8U4B3_VOLCA|nr:uncharacterized protein VOLCADRAFT_94165 [Volvox carteri f. nagariensis]EFJ45373.1 hypothetical protein VOLCADRAFT_94165 [Volvox carteri f. nagariensis]|eukprot:XP_002953400.1 hypothetical protein VOLCADRAFT_94165 [Volvox carteri f. nagariensis]